MLMNLKVMVPSKRQEVNTQDGFLAQQKQLIRNIEERTQQITDIPQQKQLPLLPNSNALFLNLVEVAMQQMNVLWFKR